MLRLNLMLVKWVPEQYVFRRAFYESRIARICAVRCLK